MTMQNVSLGASVFLPFGDDPLNFHFTSASASTRSS